MTEISQPTTNFTEKFASAVNQTTPSTDLNQHNQTLWVIIVIAILLGVLMICTTVGNSFVIAAVWKEKSLQTLTNKLVASLAVTDFLVGLLVMPLQAVYSLLGRWPFGIAVCNLFITADVLFCTSSILHLVAIAVDRYWVITDITYSRGSRLHKYMVPILITGCWLLSAAICLPPFFGWKTEQKKGECIISQDRGYTIYSTVGAFYLPLFVIIGIYIKIFLVVRDRVRRKPFAKHRLHSPTMTNVDVPASNTMVTIVTSESLAEETQPSSSTPSSSLDQTNYDDSDDLEKEAEDEPQALKAGEQKRNQQKRSSFQQILQNIPLIPKKKLGGEKSKEDKLALKRERKALRTLVIITGVFVTCWLPFFIIAIANPFMCPPSSKDTCQIPPQVGTFFTWLGYVNCMLNPIIYNIFNPDFRAAFKKILLRNKRTCK